MNIKSLDEPTAVRGAEEAGNQFLIGQSVRNGAPFMCKAEATTCGVVEKVIQ